jgi:hypothetical protein
LRKEGNRSPAPPTWLGRTQNRPRPE